MHTYAKYCTLNYARKSAFNPPTLSHTGAKKFILLLNKILNVYLSRAVISKSFLFKKLHGIKFYFILFKCTAEQIIKKKKRLNHFIMKSFANALILSFIFLRKFKREKINENAIILPAC